MPDTINNTSGIITAIMFSALNVQEAPSCKVEKYEDAISIKGWNCINTINTMQSITSTGVMSFIDLDNIKTIKPSFFENNRKKIIDKFNNEIETKSDYLFNEVDAIEKFYAVANKIAMINFKNIIVELNPSNSVKFTMNFTGNTILMVTKSFNEYPEIDNNNLVISIFESKKLIYSDIKNPEELVKGINRYISI
jgi:hypothetical protein